jgi:hypothetical protein
MMPYVRRSSSLQVSGTTQFRHPTGPVIATTTKADVAKSRVTGDLQAT